MSFADWLKEHKVLSVLWACAIVLWIVYFSYQCANISKPEKESYLMNIQDVSKLNGREFPMLFFCPFQNVAINDIARLNCRACMKRTMTNKGPEGCTLEQIIDHSFNSIYECYTWNYSVDTPVKDYGGGSIFCNFSGFAPSDMGRIYLYDAGWKTNYFAEDKVDDKKSLFPDGIIGRTVYPGSRTNLIIARDKFVFQDPESKSKKSEIAVFGYREIDAQTRPFHEPENMILEIFYGDQVEITYTSYSWKGYTFGYWLGLLGGFSFLLYVLVTAIYAAVATINGWERKDTESHHLLQ
jgi:hypothetical protein